MPINSNHISIYSADGMRIEDETVAIITAAVEMLLEENRSYIKKTPLIKRGSLPLSPWSTKFLQHRQQPNLKYKK